MNGRGQPTNVQQEHAFPHSIPVAMQPTTSVSIPAGNQKIYSVDLLIIKAVSVLEEDAMGASSSTDRKKKIVASCTNSIQNPPGGSGSISCATLSIRNKDSTCSFNLQLSGVNEVL